MLVADILDQRCERVAADITRTGGCAAPVHLDVTSAQDWQTAIVTAARYFGGLDILVNCAGTVGSASIEELAVTEWDCAVATNQTGAFLEAH
ncbi:MAG TPA: SDR family NAD(P)-dependent oxidoreductase [Streptosporangiaceae bacterium]|nr:SDR family NAD(P)-dependent oxidoreductase [Streptosporangiaceae bacterium]